MASSTTTLTRTCVYGVVAFALTTLCASVQAGPLDEMSLDRWKKLKEAERFQLDAAEKLYRERHFKVAADEYEKFLKLYERSEGAPFAQLKWSHCQIELRKANTAIKDGYQSVLDYFPDSPEAPIAAMLIGRTYRDMGDIKPAKKAYMKAISTYPKHFAAVMARLDMVDIAAKENDLTMRTTLLKELTYDVERKGPTIEPCVDAARLLTRLYFQAGNFDDGLKALATTCQEEELPVLLMNGGWGQLPHFVQQLTGAMDEQTKKLGEKLADSGAAWLKIFATTRLADDKRKAKGIDAWYAAAELRRYARQPDKQKAVLEEIVATVGANDETLGRLALFYKQNKQMELARTTYRKFKNITEGEGQVAACYAEEKQYDKAVEIYRRLAAAADAKIAPTWLKAAARTLRDGGKPDQAIGMYNDLIKSDAPNSPEYLFEIAETHYHAGRWKECITAYGQTNRFPHNYQYMAQAFRNLKQYDEAVARYNQIIIQSKDHAPWALYQVAVTHEEAGKKEEAIKVFKQVCDRYPKTPYGSQAHAVLNDKYKISVTLGGAKE